MSMKIYPVYFFPGPEIGRKRVRIQSIHKQLVVKNKEEPEWHQIYPYDTQTADIIALLQNGSLFSSHRMVILADAHVLKSSDIKSFIRYTKSPSPEATLIFTTEHTPGSRDYPRKLAEALPKPSIEVFWEMFEKNKRGWVMHFFREKSIQIEPEAVELLIDVTEGTTHALREACERLCFSAKAGDTIDENQADAVLEHGKDETVYSLFHRFCRRDLNALLEAYRKMIHSDPGIKERLLAMFALPLVSLLDFKVLTHMQLPEETIAHELKLKGGKRAIRSYSLGAQHFSQEELQFAVRSLVELEAYLRTAPRETHIPKVELWFCRIIGRISKA